jgi:hypothetical protein
MFDVVCCACDFEADLMTIKMGDIVYLFMDIIIHSMHSKVVKFPYLLYHLY